MITAARIGANLIRPIDDPPALVRMMLREHGPIGMHGGYVMTWTMGSWGWCYEQVPWPSGSSPAGCWIRGNWLPYSRRDLVIAARHVLDCSRSPQVAREAARDLLQRLLAGNEP